ncbi:MAG TPA: twitching motility protein PilT [Porphyromonadaceae bacterium]|nr:twitching motility protein PilT [Porphyromonadaceae bacterium]
MQKLFFDTNIVIDFLNEVVDKAINSNFKDFEDALQYYSAIASGCDLIITRNEKDFKDALIPVF